MNLSSALLKQIICQSDIEVWGQLKKLYLPQEYHTLYDLIDKQLELYSKFPSFEEIKLFIRDRKQLDVVESIESSEIPDTDTWILLEYLKNECAQRIVLHELESFVKTSVAISTAEETVDALHDIIIKVQDQIELEPVDQSMQSIELFEPDEVLNRHIPLGLNADFDVQIRFAPGDQIMFGGPRGSGKSLTCSNIAWHAYNAGSTIVYFTIEMPSRLMLQRICAIATGVPIYRLTKKQLTDEEWNRVAKFWADRFQGGHEKYEQFLNHRNFNQLHAELSRELYLREDKGLVIHYDPELTLGKIRSVLEVETRARDNVDLVLVDYVNQVHKSDVVSKFGQFDWKEQVEISKALKTIAQRFECLLVSPYQTDATGEARFAKGILDSADAAFVLNPWSKEDACMSFDCVKMRNFQETSFVSTMDWQTLTIGPESTVSPKDRKQEDKDDEESDDVPWRTD